MSPKEFEEIRKEFGFSMRTWGWLLGYKDNNNTRYQIFQMENGNKPVRTVQVRLIRAFQSGYRPPDWPESDIDNDKA